MQPASITQHFKQKNWQDWKYQQMKYALAEKANQDSKQYAALKELHVNDFIDSIIEKEKKNT